MKELHGGLKEVSGFMFSAVECGIKSRGRLDYALIFSKNPCNASGLFTTNSLPAAPVRLCRERINNPIHGILINAANANACTGTEGYENALSLTSEAAKQMKVDSNTILMASTGVIGVQLPVEKMRNSIPNLLEGLSLENAKLIPEAIMTTDTMPKESAVSFAGPAGEYKIAGTVKGAGMIAPNMATLLSFILTDFPVKRDLLRSIFARCVEKTLNSITVDGDMSTNDTAIILAPVSDQYVKNREDHQRFEDALLFLLNKLSEMLIRDGEGATKLIRIKVNGAKNEDDAGNAAKAVSESLLVKTAIFGGDPNWGRIACAVGYSGAQVREENLSIFFEDIPILAQGTPADFDHNKLNEILSRKEIEISIDLGMGDAKAAYLTTDISYDYVKINSEYTT